jgi:hypothetical protein
VNLQDSLRCRPLDLAEDQHQAGRRGRAGHGTSPGWIPWTARFVLRRCQSWATQAPVAPPPVVRDCMPSAADVQTLPPCLFVEATKATFELPESPQLHLQGRPPVPQGRQSPPTPLQVRHIRSIDRLAHGCTENHKRATASAVAAPETGHPARARTGRRDAGVDARLPVAAAQVADHRLKREHDLLGGWPRRLRPRSGPGPSVSDRC